MKIELKCSECGGVVLGFLNKANPNYTVYECGSCGAINRECGNIKVNIIVDMPEKEKSPLQKWAAGKFFKFSWGEIAEIWNGALEEAEKDLVKHSATYLLCQKLCKRLNNLKEPIEK